MGFNRYITLASPADTRALILYGAKVFGSINKLSRKITYSTCHTYRWATGDSNMSLKTYNEIMDIINIENERVTSC